MNKASAIMSLVTFLLWLPFTLRGQDTTGVATLLARAESLLDSADYGKALALSSQAVERVACALGEADPALGEALLISGKALLDLDRYEEVRETVNRSLAIFDGQQDVSSPLMADIFNLLGQYHYYTGDLPAAYEVHQQVLAWRQSLPGSSPDDLADSYNNLGNIYYRLGDYDGALEYHRVALRLRQAELGRMHPETASSLNNAGACLRALARYEEARELYSLALEIRLSFFGPDHPKTAQSHNNLGNVNFDSGHYDEAIRNHRQALEIRRKHSQELSAAQSLNNLANVHAVKTQLREALSFYQQTLDIRSRILGRDHALTAQTLYNIGNTYFDLGDYRRAIDVLQQALFTYRAQLPAKHPEIGYTLDALGRCHKATDRPEEALSLFLEAYELFSQAFDDGHPLLAASLNNLASSYFQLGDFAQALTYYRQSYQLLVQTYPPGDPRAALSHNNLGNCFYELGELGQARHHYQEALRLLSGHEQDFLPTLLTTRRNLGTTDLLAGQPEAAIRHLQAGLQAAGYADRPPDAQAPVELLSLLTAKGNAYGTLYEQNGDPAALLEACQTYTGAIRLMDILRIRYKEDDSKLWLLDNNFRIYEEAIRHALLAADRVGRPEYRHQAFRWAEQSKTLLLREALGRNQANAFENIPDSLIDRETDLQADILALEKMRFEQNGQLPPGQAQEIEKSLLSLRQAYNELIDTFEVLFPDYYRLRYDRSVVSVTELQNELLTPEQGLVEYFVGDSTLFLFLVTRDTFRTWSISKDFALNEEVARLRVAINLFPAAKNESEYLAAIDAYAQSAHRLYERIFAPLRQEPLLPVRLIIVPEGALSYLPFSTLLSDSVPATDRRNFHRYPYLLREFQFSYSYSASLLREMAGRHTHSKQPHFFAGFAPDFTATNLTPLQYNRSEVEMISESLNGRSFLGDEAHLALFLKQASRYRVLHLATHGKANDRRGDFAYLAFARKDSLQLLYAADLYPLNLDADLVVLSACETGIGEYRRGEGIVSLARGFTFAGARSIITTLWSIDDEKSSGLMASFYQLLKEEIPKDQALRTAKLNFLDQFRQDAAHPFYWSPYIALGDMQPLSYPADYHPFCWLTGLLLIAPVFLFFKKFRQKGA